MFCEGMVEGEVEGGAGWDLRGKKFLKFFFEFFSQIQRQKLKKWAAST